MEDYCKALAQCKLPSVLTRSISRDEYFYDKRSFHDFVNQNIDIRDMGGHLADFSQGSDVTQGLHTIRGNIYAGLQQRFPYSGNITQVVGSFYDGSKTGRLNEMDCLYVVSEPNVVFGAGPRPGHFTVHANGAKVTPREINKCLITVLGETLSEINLPEGWKHGGYASPEFSNVRCSGPAVTAMLCDRDGNHMSMDVSIVFPVTSQLQQRPDFPEQLRKLCQSLSEKVSRIQSEITRLQIMAIDLHMTGNLVDNTWQPTTALTEAEILRVLNTDCSVKGSLDICKAIAAKQQEWYESHLDLMALEEKGLKEAEPSAIAGFSGKSHRGSVLEQLHRYNLPTSDKALLSRETLNRILPYQHVWLSCSERKKFGEVMKGNASVNTAAMKHIILRTALGMKGAFSYATKTCERRLVRAVFEELSVPVVLSTAHALLDGVELQKFSVSVVLSHVKEDVARDLQAQFQWLLDCALVEVSYSESSLLHLNTSSHPATSHLIPPHTTKYNISLNPTLYHPTLSQSHLTTPHPSQGI